MFRDGHFKQKLRVNILLNDGGLGDHIARCTAISYLSKTFKFVDFHVFSPDYFTELGSNLVPEVTFHKYSNLQAEWGNGQIAYRQTKHPAHTTLKTHIVDNAFHILCDKQMTEDSEKNYCKLNTDNIDIVKFNLPEQYVVITTGYTSKVREMIPEAVNTVVDYLLSKNITPVFLGSKQTETGDPRETLLVGNFDKQINYNKGIDLIDKTTLLEAGKIISNSKAIVGLDNGLLHLAGTTNVPIVAGYTTVEPKYRLPYRNNQLGWNCYPIIPEISLKCRFCQSNWDFINKHDFKECFYKDYKCTKMLTGNKYVEKLESIVDVVKKG